jgi:hypothetical protein
MAKKRTGPRKTVTPGGEVRDVSRRSDPRRRHESPSARAARERGEGNVAPKPLTQGQLQERAAGIAARFASWRHTHTLRLRAGEYAADVPVMAHARDQLLQLFTQSDWMAGHSGAHWLDGQLLSAWPSVPRDQHGVYRGEATLVPVAAVPPAVESSTAPRG